MLKRPVALGLLVTLVAAAPAVAHGGSGHTFPTLKATAGKTVKARVIERRVRRIETSWLGAGHAAEHAEQRKVQRALRRSQPRGSTLLKPKNHLVAPDVGGEWAPGVHLPVVAINATLMHTGKILIFAYPWRPGRPDPRPRHQGESLADAGYADAYVFDPVTRTSKRIRPPVNPDTGKPAYIFCAATSLLPNGDVLVVGGDVGDPTSATNKGLNTVYTFDPDTERWTNRGRTRQGRWYPTQLEMADGRTLIIAGLPNGDNVGRPDDPDWPMRINADVEIYAPEGGLQLLNNFRVDEPGDRTRPPLPGQYPHMWWMPSGRALMTGPRITDTWSFYPSAPGTDEATWNEEPDLPTHREWASGVLQPGTPEGGSPSVMLFGGADRDDHDPGGSGRAFPAVKSTITFDETNAAAGWRPGPDMNASRAFSNSVLLPDGRTAIVGGGTGEDSTHDLYRWEYRERQKRIEIFDPEAGANGRFTLGNAQAEGRTYHSTALLLPDGRVMSAGDDINGPDGPDSGVVTDTAEIWSPPYLFGADGEPAARPVISRAPVAVAYGKPFEVRTPDTDIAAAVLVAPGAVTHDNDMNQRVVRLATPVRVKGIGVNLVAPAGANLAPPGYYMLFLLDRDGVPSVSRFVRVGPDASTPPVAYPTAPPEPPPPPYVAPSPTPEPAGESPPTGTPTVTPTPTPAQPFQIRLTAPETTLRKVNRTGRLVARVELNGAGSVTVSTALEGRATPGRIPLAPLAADRTLTVSAARERRLVIELTSAGRRRLANRETANVRLTATGAATGGPSVHALLRVQLD